MLSKLWNSVVFKGWLEVNCGHMNLQDSEARYTASVK